MILGSPQPVLATAVPIYTAPVQQEKPVDTILDDRAVVQMIIDKAEQNGLNYKTAIAVSKAESGLNPQAYNPEWHYNLKGEKVCQGSYGLFQIACVNYPGDPKDLYNPEINLEVAIKLYKERNWKPWSVCASKISCS